MFWVGFFAGIAFILFVWLADWAADELVELIWYNSSSKICCKNCKYQGTKNNNGYYQCCLTGIWNKFDFCCGHGEDDEDD